MVLGLEERSALLEYLIAAGFELFAWSPCCLVLNLPLRSYTSGGRCVLLLLDLSRAWLLPGFEFNPSAFQRLRRERTRSAERAQRRTDSVHETHQV